MNLPTDEHIETRRRELHEKLMALAPPDEPLLALCVNLGDPAECGCCFSTSGGVVMVGNVEHLRSQIFAAVQYLILGLTDRLEISESHAKALLIEAIANAEL